VNHTKVNKSTLKGVTTKITYIKVVKDQPQQVEELKAKMRKYIKLDMFKSLNIYKLYQILTYKMCDNYYFFEKHV